MRPLAFITDLPASWPYWAHRRLCDFARHLQVWDATAGGFSVTKSSKVARRKLCTVNAGQSFCIKLMMESTGCATAACRSWVAFRRSCKRRRKCGIIVMLSHWIRSGEDTGWRQDNQIYITLRETRAIVAERPRLAAAGRRSGCIYFGNVLAPPRSELILVVTGSGKQSPVNQLVLARGLCQSTSSPHSRVPRNNSSGPISRWRGGSLTRLVQIWHVLATICQTRTWVERNAAVYKAVTVLVLGFVPLSAPSNRQERVSETCFSHTWCFALYMHRVAQAQP